jgi:hypothetical protein
MFFVWLSIGALVYAAKVAFALSMMWSAGLSRDVPFLTSAALMVAGVLQGTP